MLRNYAFFYSHLHRKSFTTALYENSRNLRFNYFITLLWHFLSGPQHYWNYTCNRVTRKRKLWWWQITCRGEVSTEGEKLWWPRTLLSVEKNGFYTCSAGWSGIILPPVSSTAVTFNSWGSGSLLARSLCALIRNSYILIPLQRWINTRCSRRCLLHNNV